MRGALVVALIVALAGIGLLGYYTYLHRPNQSAAPYSECFRPLGGTSSVGVDVAGDGKSFKLTFGGGDSVEQVIDPKALEQINICVSMALGNAKFDLEIVSKPTPLGEVLNHWESSSGSTTSKLVANVSPPLDPEINNLLVSGKGERWSVVKAWCEDPKLSACLSCSPGAVSDQTQSVAFTIKDAAKLQETPLGRAGPSTGDPNAPYQRWEMVKDGTRYGLLCAAP